MSNCLFRALVRALVQSAGFSLKMKPRLVTSYILSWLDYCNCLLIVYTQFCHPISLENSKLFCKTPLGTSSPPIYISPVKQQHFARFLFQNVLSTKSLVCASVLSTVLVLLTSLNCYISALRLVHFAILLKPAC